MTRKMFRCEQFKCSYHPDNDSIKQSLAKHYMVAMCPVCASEDCQAEPHMVGEGCKNCLLCESKEGFVRSGQPKPILDIMVKNKGEFQAIEGNIVTEDIIERVKEHDRHTKIDKR